MWFKKESSTANDENLSFLCKPRYRISNGFWARFSVKVSIWKKKHHIKIIVCFFDLQLPPIVYPILIGTESVHLAVGPSLRERLKGKKCCTGLSSNQ